MTVRDGWLVEQLPRVMAADPVLRDFVTAFEQVHDTVRERIDAIEHQVDTGLASPEMLQYLGSWLGIMLEPTDPADYRRTLVREVGKLLGWRGTRYGVEAVHFFSADLRRKRTLDQVEQRLRLQPAALFMSYEHRVVVQQ